MVKRKAEISVDAWLGGGPSITVTSPTATVAAEGNPAASIDPTVAATFTSSTPEVLVGTVPTQPVSGPVAERVVSLEDEDHWFWALLEAAGYERW